MQECSIHLLICLLYPWVQCINTCKNVMYTHIYNFYIHGSNVFAGRFFTLVDTTSISISAMYLHARMFCTLTHTTSIPVGTMYLHARTFCTLAHMTSIPVAAMNLHARTFCTLSDILYPLRYKSLAPKFDQSLAPC